MTTRIGMPDLCLVALVGVSGSGKSTWAARHFLPTQVVSSDFCRGLVADDETDQTATEAAFAVLHTIVEKRLEAGRLTVVDATNVRPEDRRPLVELARRQHVLPVAIVLDVPPEVCHERNASRPERDFGPHVVRNQRNALRRSLSGLQRGGLPACVQSSAVATSRTPSSSASRAGPIAARLTRAVRHHRRRPRLPRGARRAPPGAGVEVDRRGDPARHPEGRTAVFLGDLVDRGPAVPRSCVSAMNMVADGTRSAFPATTRTSSSARSTGRDVTVSHGLAESLAQLAEEPAEFRGRRRRVHRRPGEPLRARRRRARRRARRAARDDARPRVGAPCGRSACTATRPARPTSTGCPSATPGPRTIEVAPRSCTATHPSPEPAWVNNTICIDTGCVFGGTTHRAALARDASSSPSRRPASTTSRRGRSRPSTGAARRAQRRRARPRRRVRQADHHDPPERQRSRSARRTPPPRSR